MTDARDDSEADRLRARDALILGNLRLVAYVAKRWFSPLLGTSSGDDLLGVGRLALVEAADLYDPAKGRFSTFAVSHIRYRMLDEVNRCKDDPVQISQLDEGGFVTRVAPEPPCRDDALDAEPLVSALREPDRSFVRGRIEGRLLGEMGADVGLSKERVRQILFRATATLRRAYLRRSLAAKGGSL